MSDTRKKVKEYLRRGWTVLEISRELRISPQAVYKHKDAIEGKTKVKASL